MNDPQIVAEASKRPGRCIASRDTEGPFIDVGVWTREHDPYVYLSVRWVEEIAQNLLGMVSKAEVEERYAGLEAELKEMAEEHQRLKRFEDAVAEYEEARDAVQAGRRQDAEAAFRDEPVAVDAISAPAKAEFSQDDTERERVEDEGVAV